MLKNKNNKYYVIAAVIALLIFLHFLGVLSPLESVLGRYLSPVYGKIYSWSSHIRIVFNEQSDKQNLLKDLEDMKNKVNELTVENASLKSLEQENETLREQLNFFKTNNYHYVMANIIAKGELNSAEKGQTIIIDKGSKDGIFAGLPVISGNGAQGLVVGKVNSVKEHLSEVYLATNQNCKFAIALYNQSKTSGIARGELGLTIKLDYISQSENIKVGDIVVTSGLEQDIPRGLVVGKITSITKENNELWQNAVVEPMVDLDNLIMVSILVP